MKHLIHSIARSRGFEIARLNRYGRDPNRDIQRIFRGLPIKVAFDIGANEGQTAVEFAAAFPVATIHSFEPYREAYRLLQDLASREPRVKAIECALGEVAGPQKLWVNAASVTNSLLPNSQHAAKFQPAGMADNSGTATISMSTVDDYCQECGIEFIDVLKMDTQGYELRVLKGAVAALSHRRVATILSEVLFTPLYEGQSYFHEIYEHLWDRGFRLVNLYGITPNAENYMSWCDALFVQPEVLAHRVEEFQTSTNSTRVRRGSLR